MLLNVALTICLCSLVLAVRIAVGSSTLIKVNAIN